MPIMKGLIERGIHGALTKRRSAPLSRCWPRRAIGER